MYRLTVFIIHFPDPASTVAGTHCVLFCQASCFYLPTVLVRFSLCERCKDINSKRDCRKAGSTHTGHPYTCTRIGTDNEEWGGRLELSAVLCFCCFGAVRILNLFCPRSVFVMLTPLFWRVVQFIQWPSSTWVVKTVRSRMWG